jgi:hypothetical protein
MRRAPGLHRPAGQQQSQDNAEHQLFLFRQAFHMDKVTNNRAAAIIYDLRFTIYTANSGWQLIRKSNIEHNYGSHWTIPEGR